jgi:flagellar biosynthesis/type III secretory pathway protein FliH
MSTRFWRTLLIGTPERRSSVAALVAVCTLLVPAMAEAQFGPRDRGDRPGLGNQRWENAQQNAYDRGFREGLRLGDEDARRGRDFRLEAHDVYRDADRGYQSRYGSRDVYRNSFRQGFSIGYRDAYQRGRTIGNGRSERRDDRVARGQGGYQEPAFARGYSDGFEKGLDDGRDRDRYDPVGHNAYREGDEGYYGQYGSRDVYRNNYRSGFRSGYEDGYRDGTRRR